MVKIKRTCNHPCIKDNKHLSKNENSESQYGLYDNNLKEEQQKQRLGFIPALARMVKLKSKPNLTENEKAEFEEIKDLLKEYNDIERRKLNKRFNLPEETPYEVSHKLYIEELRKKEEQIRIKNRILREEIKKSKEEYKKIMEQIKRETEQIKRDGWKAVEEFCSTDTGRYIEKISQVSEENIELNSEHPLPRKTKGKRNRLLDMATG